MAAEIPVQAQMGSGPACLAGYPTLFVKQTKRGCIKELIGCESKTEFKIATMEQQDTDVLYALEDTSFLNRFFLGQCRPWEINLSLGGSEGGSTAVKYVRPLKLMHGPMKCCCHQEVQVLDSGTNANVGMVKEQYWYCVPMFDIKTEDGTVEYRLGMPTCMGGMMVNCCAEGCCNCKIPFYVFPPASDTSVGNEVGKITKVWGGLGTELFTDADKFQVEFPKDATPEGKSRLLGSLFLLNQLFFEKSK